MPGLANGDINHLRRDELQPIYYGEGCWREIVLAFDGGGIRGFSSLLILEAILERIGIVEEMYNRNLWGAEASTTERLPYEYFDYIFGTSTGGLIAVMLGRLRMTTASCKQTYIDMGDRVFGAPHTLRWNQYCTKRLESVIDNVVDKHCPAVSHQHERLDFRQPESDKRECRTAVIAVRDDSAANEHVAHLFRTYSYPGDVRKSGNEEDYRRLNASYNPRVRIAQAARATSAAPHYFRETTVDDGTRQPARFIDGGVERNNPTFVGYWEACDLHKHRPVHERCTEEDGPCVGPVISIGTGVAAPMSILSKGNVLRRIRTIGKSALRSLTDPEKQHEATVGVTSANNVPYFRFTVEKGLGDMKMDEWEKGRGGEQLTIQKMEKATKEYLSQRHVGEKIKQCAEYLVAYRRGRNPNDVESRKRRIREENDRRDMEKIELEEQTQRREEEDRRRMQEECEWRETELRKEKEDAVRATENAQWDKAERRIRAENEERAQEVERRAREDRRKAEQDERRASERLKRLEVQHRRDKENERRAQEEALRREAWRRRKEEDERREQEALGRARADRRVKEEDARRKEEAGGYEDNIPLPRITLPLSTSGLHLPQVEVEGESSQNGVSTEELASSSSYLPELQTTNQHLSPMHFHDRKSSVLSTRLEQERIVSEGGLNSRPTNALTHGRNAQQATLPPLNGENRGGRESKRRSQRSNSC